MAPDACFTAAVTPSEPLAPWPVGHGTSLAAPAFHTFGDAAVRYPVKAAVVPEPSERCTTWIPVAGRLAAELSALMAGSFQVLILPAKMPASVSGESFRSLRPERLYSTAIPPADHGTVVTWPPLATAPCSSVALMGTSVAPKSMVPAVNCWMPAPEPTPW